ncbi:hypothetical protein CY35_12G079600 [Sphagnum magellanicum]|nr:hypothetical protein CY35_12G079600 [Sphagnum magellanicum]
MDSPSSGQGQGQVVNWYHPMNNSTHLPPKSPGYSMFEGSSLFQGGSIFSERVSFPIRGGGHKRTPSAGYLPQVQPSWLEEILESADGDVATVKMASHRRSSSDSAAFSESPYQLDSIVNQFTAEEEYYAQEAPGQHILRREISDCNRLDEQQLMPVLAKMGPFQRKPKQGAESAIIRGVSVTNPARPSASGDKTSERSMKHLPRNSIQGSANNTVVREKPRKQNPTNVYAENVSESNSHSEGSNDDQRGSLGKYKSEPEVQSTSEGDQSYQGQPEDVQTSSEQLDLSLDPKKAKRILANRQSAQRSRVRKLQYISELEMSVNALQAEVTTLSQQVGLCDHQRAILTAENVLLKQKLTSLGQTQRFKEAHHELLKKEVQRLWYQQRHQRHHQLPPLSPTGYDVQQQQLPPLSPIGYELQQQQFSKLDLGSQQQHQQLSPLSPTGYELQRQRFSKLNLGSQQQRLPPLSPIP